MDKSISYFLFWKACFVDLIKEYLFLSYIKDKKVMDTNELYLFIGKTIRTIRKARHITLSDMARELNKSVSTISKYENGQLYMGINDLLDICRILSIDVRTLLPGTETESNAADIQRANTLFHACISITTAVRAIRCILQLS